MGSEEFWVKVHESSLVAARIVSGASLLGRILRLSLGRYPPSHICLLRLVFPGWPFSWGLHLFKWLPQSHSGDHPRFRIRVSSW